MYAFLSFIHVVDCALLIVVVLLQSSKGSGLAGAFGGQGTQAVFGGRGAGTFLSRATSVLAVVFMLTSLTLTIQGGPRGGRRSALAEQAKKEGTATPFQPSGGDQAPGDAGSAPAPGGETAPAAPAGDASQPAAGQPPAPEGSAQQPPSGGN